MTAPTQRDPRVAEGVFPYPGHRTASARGTKRDSLRAPHRVYHRQTKADGRPARVAEYLREIAEAHGIRATDIIGPSKTSENVRARIALWKRLRADGFSLPQIGRWTNRHHTTVLHGLRGAAC